MSGSQQRSFPFARLCCDCLQKPAFWAAAVLLWAGLLWWLSSRNLPAVGPSFDHADKLKHLVYFALGSYGAGRFLLLTRPEWKSRTLIIMVTLFAALVGAADEFHQAFTPGRSGNDPFDWLADTLGGLLSALWVSRMHKTSAAPSSP